MSGALQMKNLRSAEPW